MATPKANESPSYCRCCLTDGGDLLFEVFVILEEFKCSICDLIAELCGIIVSSQDESSKNICGPCLQELCNTYRFRERCLRTNGILREESTANGGEGFVKKGEPESEEKDRAVSGDAKEKNPKKQPVAVLEKETQTEKRVQEKDGTKQTEKQTMFTCFECRNTFTGRQKLTEHLVIHRCPYQCNVCFKRFKRSDDLVLHRGTHFDSGRYGRIYLNPNRLGRWRPG